MQCRYLRIMQVIYHLSPPLKSYSAPSEPQLNISMQNTNEWALHDVEDISAGVPNRRAALSKHKCGRLHVNNTTACTWRRIKKTMPSSMWFPQPIKYFSSVSLFFIF